MSYAGDRTVAECWQFLETDLCSQLVDVRTVPEWGFVGVPNLSGIGKRAIFSEWQRYPDMQVNERFVEEVVGGLEERKCDRGSPLFMMCRSGVRSIAAAQALTQAGFGQVFNVTEGFEGDKNRDGHRSSIGGWKFNGLPWMQ